MGRFLFDTIHSYGWALEYGRNLVENESKDRDTNKVEHQINIRIFNNAFCGLLRCNYPFTFIQEGEMEFVRITMDNQEYQCPVKSVKNILRDEYDKLITEKAANDKDEVNHNQETTEDVQAKKEVELPEKPVESHAEPEKIEIKSDESTVTEEEPKTGNEEEIADSSPVVVENAVDQPNDKADEQREDKSNDEVSHEPGKEPEKEPVDSFHGERNEADRDNQKDGNITVIPTPSLDDFIFSSVPKTKKITVIDEIPDIPDESDADSVQQDSEETSERDDAEADAPTNPTEVPAAPIVPEAPEAPEVQVVPEVSEKLEATNEMNISNTEEKAEDPVSAETANRENDKEETAAISDKKEENEIVPENREEILPESAEAVITQPENEKIEVNIEKAGKTVESDAQLENKDSSDMETLPDAKEEKPEGNHEDIQVETEGKPEAEKEPLNEDPEETDAVKTLFGRKKTEPSTNRETDAAVVAPVKKEDNKPQTTTDSINSGLDSDNGSQTDHDAMPDQKDMLMEPDKEEHVKRSGIFAPKFSEQKPTEAEDKGFSSKAGEDEEKLKPDGSRESFTGNGFKPKGESRFKPRNPLPELQTPNQEVQVIPRSEEPVTVEPPKEPRSMPFTQPSSDKKVMGDEVPVIQPEVQEEKNPKQKKGFFSSIFGSEKKKPVNQSQRKEGPANNAANENAVMEKKLTDIGDLSNKNEDSGVTSTTTAEDSKTGYAHDGGQLLKHIHQVNLKKMFGSSSVGPYRFIFWPTEIPKDTNGKTWADILLHVTDPEGNETVVCTDGKYKELVLKIDGKEFNAFGTWNGGKFESHVTLRDKTASMFTIEEEIFKDEPKDAVDDSFLGQFRFERKGQPKHFIVPFKNNNRGELNIPIIGYVEINNKKYALERREGNSLRYRYSGTEKIIKGHWESGKFNFAIEDAIRYVWENDTEEFH